LPTAPRSTLPHPPPGSNKLAATTKSASVHLLLSFRIVRGWPLLCTFASPLRAKPWLVWSMFATVLLASRLRRVLGYALSSPACLVTFSTSPHTTLSWRNHRAISSSDAGDVRLFRVQCRPPTTDALHPTGPKEVGFSPNVLLPLPWCSSSSSGCSCLSRHRVPFCFRQTR